MFFRDIWIACVCVSITFTVGTVEAVADDQQLAREKFKEGMALVQVEDYLLALGAFKASYQLTPKATVLFNMAMCYKALFRYVESIDSFTQYLNDDEHKKKPEKKETAMMAVKEMEQLVGRLTFGEATIGAQVLLDGKMVGTTPMTSTLYLDPGQHSLRVLKNGYLPLTREINVETGAVINLDVVLMPEGARVRIQCEPEDARVFVDGKFAGNCSYEGAVAPGWHEIKVEVQGRKSVVEQINVLPGDVAVLPIHFGIDEDVIQETPNRTKVIEAENKKETSWMLIAGIATGVVGLGGVGVGGYFANKYYTDLDEGKTAARGFRVEENTDDKTDYFDAEANMTDDTIGTIAGFISGGVLLATGIVLMIVGAKKDKETQDIDVVSVPGGLSVNF